MFWKPLDCGGAPRIENKYVSRYGFNNEPRFIETYERFVIKTRVNEIRNTRRIIIVQVKNLGLRVTEKEIYDLFKTFGHITSHWIHLSEGDNCKHGFMCY